MIHESNDFLQEVRNIIAAAKDGVITTNKFGVIQNVNAAALNLYGYKKEELIGKSIQILMPEALENDGDDLSEYIKSRYSEVLGTSREGFGKKKSGELFPARLTVSGYTLDDQKMFTGIVHDLTEEHKTQLEIKELNRLLETKINQRNLELEEAVGKLSSTNQTLQAEINERKKIELRLKRHEEELESSLLKEKELNELKSRFVSMASHEFRTPLSSILSSVYLIDRYSAEADITKRSKHLDKIRSSVKDLMGILNDFLSHGKLEEGLVSVEISEICVQDLLIEVKEGMTDLNVASQEIIYSYTGGNTKIRSDRRILKNILFNLVSNAIKYSEDKIECAIRLNDEFFEIKVSDQGIGIPKADQKHMFSRFFRAENAANVQGTGLGLNIVKRYVQLLAGNIHFESVESVGTTFYIKIPLINND